MQTRGPNGLACLSNVTVPPRIMQLPWSQEKFGLVRRLLKWDAFYDLTKVEQYEEKEKTAFFKSNRTEILALLGLWRDSDLFPSHHDLCCQLGNVVSLPCAGNAHTDEHDNKLRDLAAPKATNSL